MKIANKLIFASLILTFCTFIASAKTHEIQTNAVAIKEAPDCLKRTRVEKVTSRIQTELEWTIRKVNVIWFKDETSFQKFHKKGTTVLALSRKPQNTVYIGPRVNDKNFDSVFGHELVHIILYQKYKTAIPRWLEEGLSNYIAQQGKVEYKWLASQPFPKDVTRLEHPFKGTTDDVHFHYNTSHALIEMIASKCNLRVLLQLSVERKLENYLSTYCEINDLNSEYKKWVLSKAKQPSKET